MAGRRADVSTNPMKESVKNFSLWLLLIAILLVLGAILFIQMREGNITIGSMFAQLFRLLEPRYA